MELELIECVYCHYRFYKDLGKLEDDGDAPVFRFLLSEQKISTIDYLDIRCPKCEKTFEYGRKT